MDNDDTMDPAQVAALLHAEPETIMQFARKGHLPGARIGKGWVFLRTDVFEFLRARIEEETTERRKAAGSMPGELRAVLVKQRPARRRAAPPVLPNIPELKASRHQG